MRPISLSNFINKVFSRVIHERLADFIPNLISDEQACFVKGRNIAKNILLTQEIITDIRLRTKVGPNVLLKLDMTKAYDQLSWLFLTKPYDFFMSTRGVKQGDPLSPTHFILAAEALSRGLNALHLNLYFCGFELPKWSPKINHLTYANDTIIFSSSDAISLQLVMEVLFAYESASSQLINKSKSAVYMHHSTLLEVVNKVQRITSINRFCPVNNIHDVVQNGAWDVDKLMAVLLEEYSVHILENIKPLVALDVLYWSLETRREFSVRTA
nr:uncharacterized protein LOC104104043 [Nicotiana tomentosiformis]